MPEQDTTTDAAAESTGDSAEAATTEAATAEQQSTEGETALGDAGKKALDAMKAKWKAAEQQAKETAARLAELEAKAAGTEAEHKAAQEAQRVKDEALAAANDRILKAEVRAAAASKLNDPQDALRFLDMSEFEVGSDGEVDASAISSAIDDLITSKPYLAAQGKRFQGSADGGTRNGATQPSQLSEQDVKRLADEGRHDEIVKAKSEGRLADYLAS